MKLTDTHCHLNHEAFWEAVETVIARAEVAGVKRFLVIGYDLPSSVRAVQLAERLPQLYAVVGVHPHEASCWDEEVARSLGEWASHPRVVAIGEIGLDFFRNLSPPEQQREAFQAQLEIARQSDLPVVIHCREAYEELLMILEGWEGIQGVLHCFSGTAEQATRGLNLGFYLGIGGVVTFKNAEPLRQIVRKMPLERLLLETDAPYLAPHPYRGKPNEPAYLPLILQTVADLKSCPPEEIAERTEQNANALFRKLKLS